MADKGFDVHLLMPTEELDGGNSIMAQGGIVFSTDPEDQKSLQHDMFVAGHDYNYDEAVRFLAEHGGEAVQSMLIDKLHVPFDRNASPASRTARTTRAEASSNTSMRPWQSIRTSPSSAAVPPWIS